MIYLAMLAAREAIAVSRFSPLAGIRYAETLVVISDGLRDACSFSPLAGIRYAETYRNYSN